MPTVALSPWCHEAAARMMERLESLARHSDAPHALTRLYLSPAYREALSTLSTWMREAGLEVRLDAACNLIGRREGAQPGLPTLLLGSHLDSVRNAGKYDGPLGIIAAIEAVARLGQISLPFAIEVAAWGDEEGVRFPTGLTGARAFAGTFDPAVLALTDEDGVSMRQALEACGGAPDHIEATAQNPSDYLAYLELHIEQGPVLESENLALGVVSAIAGAERHIIEVSGVAGHAGTVPMALRRDALAAAAEMVLAAEQIGQETPDLVATVGQMNILPGAVNVIPAHVRFSLDLRSPSDAIRMQASGRLFAAWQEIAQRRGVTITFQRTYDVAATLCAEGLMKLFDDALARAGLPLRHLPSGAGHDGLAIATLCPIGMLFVRCRGGISHNPAEAITEEDAGVAVSVLTDAIQHFLPATLLSIAP